jgi:hypothetical protein
MGRKRSFGNITPRPTLPAPARHHHYDAVLLAPQVRAVVADGVGAGGAIPPFVVAAERGEVRRG